MDNFFSQTLNTQRCALCSGTDFYIQDGHYLCGNCQTQNDDIRVEFYEAQYDPTTRTRKIKIRTEKTEKDIIGWTSWELYNLVLIGLVNQIIKIGADPSIKLTVLQLWTYYLTKLEVAFTSKTRKCVPKMARRFHKKDAEIIYGKIQQRKKRKRKRHTSATSASSMSFSFMSETTNSTKELSRSKRLLAVSEYDKYMQSQNSSDTDGLSSLNQSLYSLKSSISQGSTNKIRIRFNKKAKLESKKVKALSKNIPRIKRFNYRKKHVTTQYAIGPDCLTPSKLWSIIYLALRIHNEDIYLSDMLRFSRECHLSYYKLDHLLPSEILLSKSDINILTQTTDVTHKGLRRTTAGIAKFLNVNELAKPDLLGLIRRYCQDLNLPRGILLYAERLFLSSPSVMEFTLKSPLIPNYEGRAMAYIIVIMKTLFGLDDITEKEISRVVEKINRIAKDKRISASSLFSFCEWQGYLEGRKTILATVHFPSRIKYDPERGGLSHLYLRWMGLMKSQRDAEPPEFTSRANVLPQTLVDALTQTIDGINYNTMPMNEMKEFSPSLTPLQSYIDELDKENYEMPGLMRTKFEETKIGYITKSDELCDLAAQCGIKLDVIDHSLHYLEKVVPPFEQPRLPTSTEMSESVKLEIAVPHENKNKIKSENLLDYVHRNRPCKLKVNFDILKCYTTICDKIPEIDESLDFEEDSGFGQYLPDGRLNIPEDSGSEDEDPLNISKENRDTYAEKEGTEWADNKCLLNENFAKVHNLKLYNHEKESILIVKKSKEKYVRCRDQKGKFVKRTARNLRANKASIVADKSCDESSGDETVPKIQSKKKELKKTNEDNYNENDSEDDIQISSQFFELPEISILEDSNLASQIDLENLAITDNDTLYRPFRDYWMYHCIFSRVKGKNFELFEKELPKNFLWLLNECADIVEMPTQDLYEEVCLVEAYYLNIKRTKKSKGDSDYEFQDCTSKSYSNNILNKW